MPKKKQDLNERAFSIVQQLTAEVPKDDPSKGKKPSARKGGLRGGNARAAALTAKQRKEIAKLAAAARWKKSSN
jgi:hypothetical protein